MDHSKNEKKGQNVLDFKNIASQTPEKTNEPLHAILKEGGVKHLGEYKNMVKLFDSMICSLRLLSLRKKSPTFQNISAQVEILAKRKFSCKHLAQMKYLFPEVIQIDKILVHDKKSLCMKPDVKIALLFYVIEDHCQHSDFMALSQAFASRLINFFTVHPEACDILEVPLPDPFVQGSQTTLGDNEVPEALESVCRKSQTIAVEQSPADSLESLLTSNNTEMLTTPSLLPPSFSRHFSQKSSDAETEKAKLLKSPASSQSSATTDNQVVKTYQLDECPVDRVPDKDMKSEQQINLPDACLISAVNLQLIKSECESPQQKLSSSHDSLMVETPAQVTPKRSIPSCDNKLKATTTETCTSCYKPAKRFLDFSHLEGDRSTLVDSHGVGTQNYKVLHYGISKALDVDSKGSIEESNVIVSPALLGKVEDDKIFQSVGLPDLVALIHQIFQSVSCSSITKQELVHKIIINDLDIIERREVEEEIELLEKLVPDWICKKLAPSGDAMYKINKVADLASVQRRLLINT